VAVGALTVAFFAFLAWSGDGGGAASAPATVVSSLTPEPASPTTAASATPDVYGVPVRDFALGEPAPLQSGVVVYYTWANIEGPSNNLWRAYRTASGDLKMEDLFKRMPEGQPFTTAFDFAHGRLAVGLCIQSYCGGYGAPQPDSKAVLVTSDDGGVTWTVGPELPVGTFLVGYTDRGLLMGHFAEGSNVKREYKFFPSGQPLAINEGNGHAFVSEDGEIVVATDRGITDEKGNVLYTPPTVDVEGLPLWLVDRRPWAWSQWFDIEVAGGPAAAYWGERDGAKLTRVFRWRGPGLGLIAQLDADHFLGRMDDNTRAAPNSRLAVAIDLKAGVIHPLTDFVDPGSKYFVPYQVVPGTFSAARPGTGQCLNVREASSTTAAVLKCVADGVLLKVLAGSTVSADGVTWLRVELFDGRAGWVSSALLEP
jgi:hypothetical protein